MTTTTSPRTVEDLIADARTAWEEFTTAATAGKSAVTAFAKFRSALAVADAADSKAKRDPYKKALARYESIADRVNAANAAIASATIHDGALTDVPQGSVRTAAEKATQLAEANAEINRLAVECEVPGYVPRGSGDTIWVYVQHFADKPRAPNQRHPSSGFQKDYGRALDTVLAEHFTGVEKAAITAWQQQQ